MSSLIPEPRRSRVHPFGWDLGPADSFEYFLLKLSDEQWKEVRLNEKLYDDKKSSLIEKWDKEIGFDE